MKGHVGGAYGLGLEVVHITSIPIYLQGRLGNGVSCVPRKRDLLLGNSLCPVGLCPAQLSDAAGSEGRALIGPTEPRIE